MSNSTGKLFGQNVKKYRKAKGYTQLVLATEARVSEDYISEIERGTKTPSFKRMEMIARALGVKIKDLFDF